MNFKIICNDRNNYEIPYTTKIFAGGEVQVRLGTLPVALKYDLGTITIDGLIKSSDMFMELTMIADALYRVCGSNSIVADLHYLPYARQDRVCSPGEAFALSQLVMILKSVKVDKFIFDDVHSKVGKDLLDTVLSIPCEIRSQEDLFYEYFIDLIFDGIDPAIISPDKGAITKSRNLAADVGARIVAYNKVRDLDSGAIKETILIEGEGCILGNHCFIVDDLCDGGRTFVPIIKDLLERGARSVNLCVTHAILPYGLDALTDAGLDNFFYINSFLDSDLKGMYYASQINKILGELK